MHDRSMWHGRGLTVKRGTYITISDQTVQRVGSVISDLTLWRADSTISNWALAVPVKK